MTKSSPSNEQPDFRTYAADTAHFQKYENHQGRYRNNPRESDKVLHRLIAGSMSGREAPVRILDAGCSNGNLLFHLRQIFEADQIELSGFDYSDDAVAFCQGDPALSGIPIFKGDIRAIPHPNHYDIIAVNAVLYCLSDDEFEEAIKSISNALRPGGRLVIFDLITDFPDYSLTVVERSPAFRNGHTLHIRNKGEYESLFAKHGMRTEEFFSFDIEIDLPKTLHKDWLSTYTVDDDSGKKLMFRGCLFQPWSFFVVEKY